MANEEMEAAWSGSEGDHWAENADRYDDVSRFVHTRFANALPTQVGDRVLDVGCGAGGLSLELAQRCSDGHVLGVDLSPQLLDVARKRAAASGCTNVAFERADAQDHPFAAASLDLAVSGFGVMFFDDPAAAFANIASALSPGGRFVVAAWRSLQDNEWLMEFRNALAMGRDLPFPPLEAPTPFSLADCARTTALLTTAGFGEVGFEAVDEPMVLGVDTDDAFAFVRTMGIVRGLTHDLEESQRSDALGNLRRVLADHETPEGVRLMSAAWVISARSDAR